MTVSKGGPKLRPMGQSGGLVGIRDLGALEWLTHKLNKEREMFLQARLREGALGTDVLSNGKAR